MISLSDFVRANSDDASALAAYLAQPAEGVRTPIQAVRSWLAASLLYVPLQQYAMRPDTSPLVAGFVLNFLAGLSLAESFDGTDPTIFAAARQVVPALVAAGVMSQAQADELLAFVVIAPMATPADVAAARLSIARDARLVSLETFASAYRVKVLTATSIDALPAEVE